VKIGTSLNQSYKLVTFELFLGQINVNKLKQFLRLRRILNLMICGNFLLGLGDSEGWKGLIVTFQI